MSKHRGRLSNVASREPQIAEVLLDHLLNGGAEQLLLTPDSAEPPEAPLLVVNDDTGSITQALGDEWAPLGIHLSTWNRRALQQRPASAYPTQAAASGCILRLPKDWASFEFALQAIAGLLPSGAPLWVYGGNDEGIRSAPRRIEEQYFGSTETEYIKKRARVLFSQRNENSQGLPKTLDSFRQTSQISLPLPGGPSERSFHYYPGAFAKGGLDIGTQILLEACAQLKPRKNVLDFCTGIGVVGSWVEQVWPEAELSLLEVDAPSLAAASLNLPKARAILSDGFSQLPKGPRFDAILSNPPIHQGVEEDLGLVHQLIREAPKHLTPSGVLVCVCQKSIGVGPLFEQAFKQSKILAETTSFQVWCGSHR